MKTNKKGSVGTPTNIIIRTPKRKKIKSNCKGCINYRSSSCIYGRSTNRSACKWYAKNNDYTLSREERQAIRTRNKNPKKYNKLKKEESNHIKRVITPKIDWAAIKASKW